ncbi:ricin B lectin domain-containing protein [Mycena galericulata]|nr:ricin B lectin domain-containing protein [Mycena galericulata]
MCLAAAPSFDGNGAAVVIEYCAAEGNARQSWTISKSTLQVLDNMCLDVTGGATANGTPVQIWECTAGDANQQWTLSGPEHSIQWSEESSCLDLTNGNATNNTVVRIPFHLASPSSSHDSIYLSPIVDADLGLYRRAKPTMDDDHWPIANHQAHHQRDDVPHCAYQRERWGDRRRAVRRIHQPVMDADWLHDRRLRQLNMCLDVTNGNTANGTKLQIWACTPGDANQQLLYDIDNGSIMWAEHDECVDLTNGSLENGNQVQMTNCYQNYTQVWNFGVN